MQKKQAMTLLSPFSAAYWKESARTMKNIRVLALMAVLIAVSVVISGFYIPVAQNLRIYFTFIATSVAGWIGGPLTALVYGFVSDILGFVLHPSGGFFPGYTLTSMLGALLYALFFFRAKISIPRIFLCMLSINVLINILLGSVWSAMLYGKGYYYYLVNSIVKNLLLLPLETVIMAVIIGAMLPMAVRAGLVPVQQLAFTEKWQASGRKLKAFCTKKSA